MIVYALAFWGLLHYRRSSKTRRLIHEMHADLASLRERP